MTETQDYLKARIATALLSKLQSNRFQDFYEEDGVFDVYWTGPSGDYSLSQVNAEAMVHEFVNVWAEEILDSLFKL